MANNYRTVMQRAGVQFQKPLDWDTAINEDTLVTYPPALLAELKMALRFLSLGSNDAIRLAGKSIFGQLMNLFSGEHL